LWSTSPPNRVWPISAMPIDVCSHLVLNITSGNSVFTQTRAGFMEIDLYNAVLKGTVQLNQETVYLESFTHTEYDVIVIDVHR
jgi:hypothetical protein